jgi:hypothetical protein
MGGFPDQKKKLNPHLGFAIGVQMLFPEKDALVAHCHVQTIPSYGAHLVPLLVENQPENLASGGVRVILIVSQELNALVKHGINPVGFYLKTGQFGGLLASAVLNIQVFFFLTAHTLCVHMLIYW